MSNQPAGDVPRFGFSSRHPQGLLRGTTRTRRHVGAHIDTPEHTRLDASSADRSTDHLRAGAAPAVTAVLASRRAATRPRRPWSTTVDIRSSVVSSQVDLPRFGGVVPEIAVAHASSSGVVAEALVEAGRASTTSTRLLRVTDGSRALLAEWRRRHSRHARRPLHRCEPSRHFRAWLEDPDVALRSQSSSSRAVTRWSSSSKPTRYWLLGQTRCAPVRRSTRSRATSARVSGGPTSTGCARGTRARSPFPDRCVRRIRLPSPAQDRGHQSVRRHPETRRDLAASFQEAVVDVLVEKLLAAGRHRAAPGHRGGVAANLAPRPVQAGGTTGAPRRAWAGNRAMIARPGRGSAPTGHRGLGRSLPPPPPD